MKPEGPVPEGMKWDYHSGEWVLTAAAQRAAERAAKRAAKPAAMVGVCCCFPADARFRPSLTIARGPGVGISLR